MSVNKPHEPQQMLHKFADEGENQGMKINVSKIKVIMENDTSIYVNNTHIESIERCIYLGLRYSIRDKSQSKEIERRIQRRSTATSLKVTLEYA